ncbi:NUMOD4 domain-containing protein [Atopobiaceae bacterium HCP3S3_F7]|uniref:NUMOD4 domain-containing protein n=1 Tax=unclassified Collinsella TaxID=2637548 RepID=UPI003F8FEFBC
MVVKWRPIKGFEGMYEVSNTGIVRSLNRKVFNGKVWYLKKGNIIKSSLNHPKGYLKVGLWKDGKQYIHYIHHLVYEAFLGERDLTKELNHIDEDSQNNCLENLEEVTPLANKHHGTRIERCAKGHLKPIEVTFEDGSTMNFSGQRPFMQEHPQYKQSGISKALKYGIKYKGTSFRYIK